MNLIVEDKNKSMQRFNKTMYACGASTTTKSDELKLATFEWNTLRQICGSNINRN